MLKEIIDKFYLDKEKSRTQTSFYVSQAGKCPRQVFFKFKNAPKKELEANILRLFDHGDHIHQLIMKPLLSTRDIHVVASEVDIPPQELVRGRADAIVSDGKDLYVLDIKSMNSMMFQKMTEPKRDNVDQIQLYLHYFRIPRGILLYVDKDKLNLKEFVVEYDKKRTEEMIEGLKKLKGQIESDIIPARIPEYPAKWPCGYCEYREICDLGDEGEMKWRDLKSKIQSLGD